MKIKFGKKGAALMQVLLITVILAGIATMLLRMGLSRTSSARRTRRLINAQALIESCMAEINMVWASKTPEAFTRDLRGQTSGPCMVCKNVDNKGKCTDCSGGQTSGWSQYYHCAPVTVEEKDANGNVIGSVQYKVRAYLKADDSDYNKSFSMAYEVVSGNQSL